MANPIYASGLKHHLALLLFGGILLLLCFILSLCVGQDFISPMVALQALTNHDPLNIEHVIVTTTRLSRSIIAMVVGACLAVAGTLMQALTRNPLASPSIFGINAGAMFSIVLFSMLFKITAIEQYMWLALLGAFVSGAMVYFIGTMGSGRLNTLSIVLAGAAITALFSSFTQALLIIDQEGLDSILFWLAGSVANRQLDMLWSLLPYMSVAMVVALLLAIPINILMAGEDIAKGLGQRTALVQLTMGLIITVLAGCSVAIAGSIAFVGLIVPHIVRRILSPSHQWLIPGCIIFGASLLLLADIIARVIIFPQEIPIGVMTALLGAPLFIYLIRRGMSDG
ncbi:FecCD family ABC transporter permease [Psychrobacter sp. I-STPA10]|uniref:FecCD family ABC transporter permease n=1 Tax=Psychrobacter sp. I-STPA10 TaxID=2585769 RepID=UPI001E41A1E8|nr:iron ABC transporter permease [Psychrobacter sp. I-STPA10]